VTSAVTGEVGRFGDRNRKGGRGKPKTTIRIRKYLLWKKGFFTLKQDKRAANWGSRGEGIVGGNERKKNLKKDRRRNCNWCVSKKKRGGASAAHEKEDTT